jgi:hypothetical protein
MTEAGECVSRAVDLSGTRPRALGIHATNVAAAMKEHTDKGEESMKASPLEQAALRLLS